MNPFNIFKRKPKPLKKSYSLYDLLPRVGTAPKWTDFTIKAATRKAFAKSTWVYACIRTRANNIASVPWIAEKKVNGEWTKDENSELQKLIDRPSPDFSWADIIRLSVYSRDLSGDFYMLKERTGEDITGKVKSVFPLLPERMEVIPAQYRLVSQYRYTASGKTTTIPAENIIHLKYTSPESLYYGHAPLQSIARAVDIDEEAEKWQKQMLENMAIPSGIFAFDNITQPEYETYKKWVSEQLDEQERGRPLVVGNGKWQATGQTAQELAFIQSRKLIREEICSGLAVMPVMIGILENATLANIETAKKILWDEGLLPVIKETEIQINRQLVDDPNYRISADLSSVPALQEDYAEKIKTAREMFAMGITLEEINERLELELDTEKIPHAKTGYLASSLVPTDLDMGDYPSGGIRQGEEVYGDEA